MDFGTQAHFVSIRLVLGSILVLVFLVPSACYEFWLMLNYFGQKFENNGHQVNRHGKKDDMVKATGGKSPAYV